MASVIEFTARVRVETDVDYNQAEEIALAVLNGESHPQIRMVSMHSARLDGYVLGRTPEYGPHFRPMDEWKNTATQPPIAQPVI